MKSENKTNVVEDRLKFIREVFELIPHFLESLTYCIKSKFKSFPNQVYPWFSESLYWLLCYWSVLSQHYSPKIFPNIRTVVDAVYWITEHNLLRAAFSFFKSKTRSTRCWFNLFPCTTLLFVEEKWLLFGYLSNCSKRKKWVWQFPNLQRSRISWDGWSECFRKCL